ncbi:hypothetical protein IX27_05690 [Streptomyces sp. JS01]|nr:hypothetical protein IX27_05690 [Streptomyces sp. JS01]
MTYGPGPNGEAPPRGSGAAGLRRTRYGARGSGRAEVSGPDARDALNAAAGTVRAGPVTFLESRTGTMPCGAARLVATSTHWPPFSL